MAQQPFDPTIAVGRTTSEPYSGGKQITPSDAVGVTARHRSLWIGAGGTLKVDVLDEDGTTVNTIATTVATGTVFPYRVLKVYATGTTATGIATGY